MPPRKRSNSAARFVEPQLATLVDLVPEGAEWIHEVKFDGYRAQCLIESGRVRILTRRGLDWTAKFSPIAAALAKRSFRQASLDGEIVARLPDGRSSFSLLQQRLNSDPPGAMVLYAFDLLSERGVDLRALPLAERKVRLRKLLGPSARRAGGMVRFSDNLRGKSDAVLAKACRLGLEGVVSKRGDEPYRSGRSRSWLKIKCINRQEFVVVGYTDPKGSRVGLGALLLGVHQKGKGFQYVGRVGTGMDDELLRLLQRDLARVSRTSATVALPRGVSAAGVHWVAPQVVVEVEFTEWTRDGVLRHPAFVGRREDKAPQSVVRESPQPNPRKRKAS